MSNAKTFLNFYWSVRKYLYDNFPLIPTFYTPMMARPSLTADKTLLVELPDESFGRLATGRLRIICVAKNDPESIKITELVSAVVEKFASPASGLKSINFLDNATNTVLGRIWIKEPVTRITLPYSEGFIQKAVDMDITYTVEQRHLFA